MATIWVGLLQLLHTGRACCYGGTLASIAVPPLPQASSLPVLPLEESLQTAPPALLRFPLRFLLPDS